MTMARSQIHDDPLESLFGAEAPVGPLCEAPGCTLVGTHRAPKDRTLNAYYRFCLEHVRAYNAAWDYHAGMTDDERAAELYDHATWGRPTWPMGGRPCTNRFDPKVFRDPLGVFEDEPSARAPVSEPSVTAEMQWALDVMGLDAPVSVTALKAAFKAKAKILHPDVNQDDPSAEEAFKRLQQAYNVLSKALDGFIDTQA